MAFLLFAVLASAVGIAAVVFRNRRPSIDGAQHRGVRARPARARTRALGAPSPAGRVEADSCLAISRSISVRRTRSSTRARSGIILNEPTVIALNSRTQDVLAMGQEAWQMIGRTPGYIVAVRPLRGGAITDFDITQRMIRLLFQRAGINRLYRARVLICVPSAITHVEQRAVLEAARRAGAAQTYLIEQPMAAAIGAGLPIHEPMGNMVIDVGGGTTEVAVISLGGVVALEALRVGSFDIDAAIQGYVRREYGIAIGERTAEEIKLAIGSAWALDDDFKAEVRGRDLMSGLPKTIMLVPEEVRGAIEEQLRAICDAVIACLARTPPELAQDLILNGVHLVGGGRCCAASSTASARRPICPCISSTRRSSASCSARAVASRASRASRACSWRAPTSATDSARCGRRQFAGRAEQVFGGLADLPVAVGRARREAGFHLGAFERGEREHRAAADRGLVVARGEHDRERAGSPIAPSAATAASRTSGSSCPVAARRRPRRGARSRPRVLAERERGGFRDERRRRRRAASRSAGHGAARPSAGASSRRAAPHASCRCPPRRRATRRAARAGRAPRAHERAQRDRSGASARPASVRISASSPRCGRGRIEVGRRRRRARRRRAVRSRSRGMCAAAHRPTVGRARRGGAQLRFERARTARRRSRWRG